MLRYEKNMTRWLRLSNRESDKSTEQNKRPGEPGL